MTQILDQILDPVAEVFTPELAAKIVELKAEAPLLEQVETWRAKATNGTITPEENAAYQEFVEAVDLIAILQSKARKYLASN